MIVESKKLRDAARGEECTLEVAGVCNYDPETTVLCHFPSEIAGYKPTDLSAGFGCSSCHDWIDMRSKDGINAEDREMYMRRSQVRTMSRLVWMGIITVKGAGVSHK